MRTHAISRWKDYNEVKVSTRIETDFAYLAGILDGEGTFVAYPTTHSFGLMVSMIDREVIEWLHERFGGSTPRGGFTSVGNPIYRWSLNRHADLGFVLARVLPYLVLKKEQAVAMMALVEHLGNPPTYDIPTSRAPKSERPARAAARRQWRERGLELRTAVRDARFSR